MDNPVPVQQSEAKCETCGKPIWKSTYGGQWWHSNGYEPTHRALSNELFPPVAPSQSVEEARKAVYHAYSDAHAGYVGNVTMPGFSGLLDALIEAVRREQDGVINREVMVDILVHHWATATSGCLCGGVRLGESFPEHIVDVYDTAMKHVSKA